MRRNGLEKITRILTFSFGTALLTACVTAPRSPVKTSESCLTVDQLALNSLTLNNRPICVEGYLGEMVPFGEDAVEIFATRRQAKEKRAEYYVHIGVRLTPELQPRFAARALERIQARGIFETDKVCWPESSGGRPYTCFPPRPMRLRKASIRFSDGSVLP